MKFLYVHANQEANPEISENGINWKSVSSDELENALSELSNNKDGAIIYSREDASLEPVKQCTKRF